LENQQIQEKKLNENDRIMKQKTVADSIRSAKTASKSNYFSVSAKKGSERKPMKTEIDISEDMQGMALQTQGIQGLESSETVKENEVV